MRLLVFFLLVRAGEQRGSFQMEAGKLQGTEAAHGTGAHQLRGRQLPHGSQETAWGAAVGVGPQSQWWCTACPSYRPRSVLSPPAARLPGCRILLPRGRVGQGWKQARPGCPTTFISSSQSHRCVPPDKSCY